MSREHGTHNCYVHGPDRRYQGRGCRCEPCRQANSLYERARARRVTPAYIDATPARRHVRKLMDAGVGLKTIAKKSGVAHGTLSKLIYGDYGQGTPPSKRIRPETQDKLLAVKASDAADNARIPAAPTWAHIDTLLARGWTKAAIARAIGQRGDALQLGRREVHARNARSIAALLNQPVPPRRSRFGEHPVPQPEVDELAELRDQARRENQAKRRAFYRSREHGDDPYELPTLKLAPTVLRRGACRTPDVPTWLFFPYGQDTETIDRAKAVCATCPVTTECLNFALTNREHGIWGGTTEQERAAMVHTHTPEPGEKTCEHCAHPYTPRRGDQRWCSTRCRDDAYNQRHRAAS